jgi:hypothetical protein
MSDQFKEWDKFMAANARAETPEDAFKKYKKNRKKRRGIPPWLRTPEEKLKAAYQARVEKRRIEALELKASALVAESSLRASKLTTKG